MPGIDFEERRERALTRYRRVIEDAGIDVTARVVPGTPHRRDDQYRSHDRRLSWQEPAREPRSRIERGTDDPDVLRKHLFRRLLFATDFSKNAERAFEAFSHLRHATLVHVETPKDPHSPTGALPNRDSRHSRPNSRAGDRDANGR